MFKNSNKHAGFVHLVILIPIVAIVIVAIAGVVVVSANNDSKKSVAVQDEGPVETSDTVEQTDKQEVKAETQPEKSNEANTTQAQPSAPPAATTSEPTKVEVVEPQSCLPSNVTEYDKYHIKETNSQYIKGGSYIGATKFYDALVFAGLKETIDKPKVVVFAMSDSVFNKLSQAQLDYMNASPANMKSVIGWHVVQSCVVWKNNIANKTSAYSFDTLNGKVTHTPGSPGKVNDASMAIWDWYTSNGAVHFITNFIKAPTI